MIRRLVFPLALLFAWLQAMAGSPGFTKNGPEMEPGGSPGFTKNGPEMDPAGAPRPQNVVPPPASPQG